MSGSIQGFRVVVDQRAPHALDPLGRVLKEHVDELQEQFPVAVHQGQQLAVAVCR